MIGRIFFYGLFFLPILVIIIIMVIIKRAICFANQVAIENCSSAVFKDARLAGKRRAALAKGERRRRAQLDEERQDRGGRGRFRAGENVRLGDGDSAGGTQYGIEDQAAEEAQTETGRRFIFSGRVLGTEEAGRRFEHFGRRRVHSVVHSQ